MTLKDLERTLELPDHGEKGHEPYLIRTGPRDTSRRIEGVRYLDSTCGYG